MDLRESTLLGNDLLARIFLRSSEALALARTDGRIAEANDAFLLLIGRTRSELVGTRGDELGIWSADEFEALEGSGAAEVGVAREHRLSAERVDLGGEQLVLLRAHVSGAEPFQQLRETMVRYRTLVEQVPAIVYIEVADDEHESGFRVTYASPQSSRIIGYSPEELMADPDLWYRRMPPEDRHRLLSKEKTQADTTTSHVEYRIIARDGRTVWFRDDATRIVDEQTGETYWQGVMMDVTEEVLARRQVEDAQRRFQTLVEHLPAIVYIDALDWRATNQYTSPRTAEILGYTAEEWTSDPDLWPGMLHPDDSERVLEAQRRHVEEYEPLHEEYRVHTKDGRVLWLMDEAVVVRDERDRPLYSQGFLFDITRRKEAEAQLAAAVEREHQAAEQLRTLDALKNTLLHAISHDLRSPIATILAVVSALERHGSAINEDDARDLLQGIGSRARKMSRLLEDLLDLDRLERGIAEPNRVQVDVGELVRCIADECELLEGRDVELHLEPVGAELDGPKVERIVDNLLANAAKHTPARTRVWIRASRDEAGVLIVVEDDGPGVPDQLKEAIFQPFQRGASSDGAAAGSGIGLSLVSRFAELHGGRAWVEDRPGGGASFRVLLPG